MNNTGIQRWKSFIYIKSRKSDQILSEIYTIKYETYHSIYKILMMEISNHHSNLNLQ